MKSNDALMWLLSVAGLVLGGILTIAGIGLLKSAGPGPLIVGLIFLAFGGAAFFVRQSNSKNG